ncbi:MAG: 3D domain-containing protein [Akkermansia sp.]|nr:3D domain-containing protein [Akkermansia sp.]
MPSAPSPSARPDSRLPRLGRDKHGMPFYHPAQLNRVVRTTAYTHTESDHIGYGPRNAIGTTLKYTEQVRSAAADWSVYPLGTRFRIKGQPYIYVIDDYGSALVGTGTIDIYQPTPELMRRWGRRVVEIQIIQWGSSQQSMRTLQGRTGYRHCARMQAALQQQSRHRNTARR